MHFQKKETWIKSGQAYSVEVSHWKLLDQNKWNIYVTLFNGHNLYDKINKENVDRFIDFHGGCTYFCKTTKEYYGIHESITIGCDYQHYGDELFSLFETEKDAENVFIDAASIFNYLRNVKWT